MRLHKVEDIASVCCVGVHLHEAMKEGSRSDVGKRDPTLQIPQQRGVYEYDRPELLPISPPTSLQPPPPRPFAT